MITIFSSICFNDGSSNELLRTNLDAMFFWLGIFIRENNFEYLIYHEIWHGFDITSCNNVDLIKYSYEYADEVEKIAINLVGDGYNTAQTKDIVNEFYAEAF